MCMDLPHENHNGLFLLCTEIIKRFKHVFLILLLFYGTQGFIDKYFFLSASLYQLSSYYILQTTSIKSMGEINQLKLNGIIYSYLVSHTIKLNRSRFKILQFNTHDVQNILEKTQ